MSGLLRAELRRFWSRRLLWALTLLQFLLIAYGAGRAFWNGEFHLRDLSEVFLGASLVLTLVGWVLGASSIGAEWHTGLVGTLLTWEPRRARVLAAKVLVTLGSMFALSIAMQVVLGCALGAVAAARGSTAGVDGTWLAGVVDAALRAAALGTFGAAIGFAFAAVGRNTAAALGFGFAYFVVAENAIRAIWPRWGAWLVTENASAFLLARSDEAGDVSRSGLAAGLYLAAVAAALLLVAAVVFRARDVT